jgi:putative membrane protein
VATADALAFAAQVAVFGSVTAIYLRGVAARRRRGRTTPRRSDVTLTLSGLGVTWIALSVPFDHLADEIFWVHMTQHLLLIAVAAPLLIAGEPLRAFAEAVSAPWRRGIARVEGRLWRSRSARRTAIAAFAVSLAALVAWHLPPLFELALRSEPAHVLEHVTLLGTACAFWWPVLARGPRHRIGPAFAIAEVAVAGGAMGVLGALLTFSPVVWYPAYRAAEAARGLDPLADQQAAGLIMWIPAGFIYLGFIAWLFIGWIEEDQPSTRGQSALARVGGVTRAGSG